jgi:hypothetical protein
MANWPTRDDYLGYARIGDVYDDAIVESSLAAVIAAVKARCPSLVEVEDPDVPDDVRHACLLWCNRLVARRNSPEGIVGSAEFGVANVGRYDPDVERLLSPWKAVTLA